MSILVLIFRAPLAFLEFEVGGSNAHLALVLFLGVLFDGCGELSEGEHGDRCAGAQENVEGALVFHFEDDGAGFVEVAIDDA